MAAFYPFARRHFYWRGFFHRDRFRLHFLRLRARSEVEKIVYGVSEILFATEITFRCLDGCVPQQELNLLQFATAAVAQLRTGSPQVMRCNMLQARYVPHDILRDVFPQHFSCSGDGSKDPSLRDPGCDRPLIECRFHPFWNWHGADVATLADQITTA